MDDLFNKRPNQFTEADMNQLSKKQKKALKVLFGSKPSVPFSLATFDDCERSDGLALNIAYATVKVPTIHIPVDFVKPTASDHLCENLARIEKVWVLNNERAYRIVINAILIEVLMTETNEQLWGFCDVKNDWEGIGVIYTGAVDYMFGSGRIKSVDTMDSSFLVVQAKKEWPDSSIPQVLCAAGCALRKRMAAGKNTPVFAALTNGLFFRFFVIDTDGMVYASTTHLLDIGDDETYKSSTSLSEILRWFTWFMTSIKSVSPGYYSEDVTPQVIDNSLTRIRSCFGPTHPI
ncbi:hypothetical protein BC833DRAFT_556687 [Globomyces pollinis-pini]|nr:hypothetical protein BC833DRAFT_556687 [Globomyces pollinis-pini]